MKKRIENILDDLETLNNEMTQDDPSFDKALTNLKKISEIKNYLNKHFLKKLGEVNIVKEVKKDSFIVETFKED